MTIENEHFYNLCQSYRHAPATDPAGTVAAYKALIFYIDDILEEVSDDSFSEGYQEGLESGVEQ